MATQLRDAAEGRLVVPLPEVDDTERPAVANLIVQGIDQTGMRIASVPAQTRFYPTKPGQKTAEKDARLRGAAFKGVHAENTLNLQDRRRARWFVAYGTAPVVLRPLNGRVMWEARDPLTVYPAPSADPDAMMSDNCVMSIMRPWWWVRDNYPEAAGMLRRPKDISATEQVTVVEYIDSDTWGLYAAAPGGDRTRFIERVHGASYSGGGTPGIDHSGPTVTGGPQVEWEGTENAVTLVETKNRAGLCPVVNPQRICLGEVVGQFDQMVGIYAQQAKLMALEINAVTESVFPPVWAIQNAGEQLEVVTVADGKRGVVGVIRGGSLNQLQLTPGFQTYPTIDRLERVQRLNGGIPADYDGSTQTHISGSRGQQVLSAVIDFPIQEAQESFARSRWHENVCAIAIGKANFGNKVFAFGAAYRARGPAEWTWNGLFPNEESVAHSVSFPYPGTDANGSLIRTGQKMGLGLESKQTARENDPEIDDPELEKDRIDAEALEDALRASVQQQAASGALDPRSVARIAQLVRSDREDLADAIIKADDEARAAQATPAPVGAPETQQGLVQPGAAAAQPPADPNAAPDLNRLRNLLGNLRLSQNSTPQEQRAEQAAAVGA